MGAGELNRRITLRQATVEAGAFNAPVTVWADLATVWAKKTDVSDAERIRAQQVGASITSRFLIRWTLRLIQTLKRDDQVLFRSVLYDITDVKEVCESGDWRIEITASAQADGPLAP